MEVSILAVKFLGTSLIALIIGFVVCFLAVLGYNTYIRFHTNKKRLKLLPKKNLNLPI